MLPNSTENILQDTKNVPVTPVNQLKRTRVGIVIVFLFLGIGLYVAAVIHSRRQLPNTQPTAVAMEPTPLPLTGTFLDSVYGTVIFSKDSKLSVLNLPNRIEHTIQDSDGESTIQLDTAYPPVWSPDGKLIALVTKDGKVAVSEFDTGKYRGTFSLPQGATAQSITISIDPASEILAMSQLGDKTSDPQVRFFSFATQKEIGVYPRCSGTGVWMTGIGFAMLCTVGDSQSVVVIRFEPNSSVMTPLTRETQSVKYQLVDEYQPGTLLLKRTQSGKQDLVTLSVDGKVTLVPQTEYKPITDIQKIVDANVALRQRIEKEVNLGPVIDVTVAKDNSFLIFETASGLYATKLSLKDQPYFLGVGTKARIRPF